MGKGPPEKRLSMAEASTARMPASRSEMKRWIVAGVLFEGGVDGGLDGGLDGGEGEK